MSEDQGGDPENDYGMDVPNYGDRMTPGRANQITLARVNTPTRNILKKFDNNGDGRIDANEIQTIVSTLVAEKFKSKAFKIGLIILCVFTAILLGAMFGLTWAVVAALKDTQVQGSILVTNDKAASPVLVGNLDLTVSSDVLVSRRDNSTVVSTARIQTPGIISAHTSFDKLLAMQNLVFKGANNSDYALAILGIARIPNEDGSGYAIRFQTASGVLTFEKGVWTVSDVQGPLLENLFAGATDTSGGRRRLLEQDEVFTYAMCELGSCGEALPCGFGDFPACEGGGSGGDGTGGSGEGGYTDNTNNTASGSCGYLSASVTVCSAGLTSCYGYAPTADQRTRYMGQAGCSTGCKNFNWWYNGRECEGPSTNMRNFCCL